VTAHRTDFHDSITPAQGRVLFHAERLLRSTGAMPRGAHEAWISACRAAGLDPVRVTSYSREDCRTALRLLEGILRARGVHRVPQVATV